MPTKPKVTVEKGKPLVSSWSWSRYQIYCECPCAFKFQFIERKEKPAGPAMARGREVHKTADAYVRAPATGKGAVPKKIPDVLKNFTEEFKMLRKVKAITEDDARIGLNRSWNPVDYFDWTNCWLRVIIDAKYIKMIGKATKRLVIIDHKTGRVYEENKEQLDLSATAAFRAEPDVDEVEVQLWYLDQGVILPEKPLVFGRDGNEKQVEKWNKRVYPMFTDKRFVPNPGQHCHRCHYRKANGGPCKY